MGGVSYNLGVAFGDLIGEGSALFPALQTSWDGLKVKMRAAAIGQPLANLYWSNYSVGPWSRRRSMRMRESGSEPT